MAMFENQPPRTVAPAQAPAPTRIPPPPIRPAMPATEPEDIFAGVEKPGPRPGGVPPTMPVAPRRKGRKIVLVFIIFIIVILLVAGGVLAYLSFMRQAPVNNANIPVNVNQLVNANTNTNTNVNVNTNTNGNANTNLQPVVGPAYTLAKDTDLDGLSDIEEDLYGTNKDNPDTDGDTYLDGAEFISLYDPTKTGGALLAASTLVKSYENITYKYSVLYPAKWQAIPVEEGPDGDRQITFFTSVAELENENIKVRVADNPNKSSLYEFVLSALPTADLTMYEAKITKGGFNELVSPDKLTYYVTKEGQLDRVYVFSYTVGADKIAKYLSTLQMMVNSFSLTPNQAILPPTTKK